MPSVSKKQQKFMGIVRAIQKGEADPSDFNKDAQDAAKKMKKTSVKKYAKTKHKGLPTKKVNEQSWHKDFKGYSDKELKVISKFIMLNDKGIDGVIKMSKKKAFKPMIKKMAQKGLHESLTPAEVKKERELFKKTGDLPPRLQKVVDDYENERKAFHKKMKKKFKGNVKGDWVDVVVPGLEWMSKLGESAQRDYKAEYKKFQSSPKAKKYRAELNKYNRQKGTYGNGDGKDASHKGGKIVGFEKESTNRGRAEKSRLKKEINDYVGSIIDETLNENPAAIAAAQRMVVQSKGKKISVNTARGSRYKDKDPAAHKKAKSMFSRLLDKFRKKNESQMFLQMAKQLKEADESVNEIKVWDVNEACWKGYEKKGMKTMFGKRYPNCVKKKKSESVNEAIKKVSDAEDGAGYRQDWIGVYKGKMIQFKANFPADAKKHTIDYFKVSKSSWGDVIVVSKKEYDSQQGWHKQYESVNEQSKVIKSIDNLAKKNKYGTVTGTQMNGKTANTIMKIYNHPKMKRLGRQKDLDNMTSDELANLTIDRDVIRILGLNEAVYKFRGYTNTQMDELDAMLARAGYKGTPDFNKMTWTTKDKNPKIAKIIKSKGGKKIKEDIKKDSGLDHNQVMTKFISDAMKKAGIRIIKVDMMKKGRFAAPEGDQWYGAFFTVASSNMTDMPGQGKVKRSSAVLPIYVDKKGNLDLRVAPKKFIIGKYPNMNQVVKTLKSFKKSDLEESINERAWTLAQEKAVKELDKKFFKLIGKKGIEPYSYEASQMWTSGGFRKEMRKIFGKDVKESVNENISDSQKFKIYNSLKKGDIVSIKYDSSIAKGSKFHPFLVTKGKTKLMKGKVERIIMVPAGGSKAKRYLYNRNGRISLALGDLAAVIVDMKKGEVNEGTCGYGEDGKLGEEPAGPHLLKKKKNEIATRNRKHLNKFSKSQLDTLRKQYGTVKGVNPSSPTYKKLVYMLDSLPLANLKQLEKAKIPFISGLARNRVYRAKKFGSTTGG